MATDAVTISDYAIKPSRYFENRRPEMLSLIPPSSHRVLDVGCGTGEFGAAIKHVVGAEVWGVEPFASAAATAATKLDGAIHSAFPTTHELPDHTFDCVVFNDVLEHMLDPEAALHAARRLLTPDGVVIASIPNIRHFPTLWRLVVQGDWTYRDCGTLDKTHLRFFTKSSIAALFTSCGYTVDRLFGINSYCAVPSISWHLWRLYRVANVLALGRLEDLKYLQFAVVARPVT